MAELRLEQIPVASAGLDTESSPDAVARGKAPEHANFLVHHASKMPIRGPIQNHTIMALGTDVLVTGQWQFNDRVLIGLASKSESASREPWTAPYRQATGGDGLSQPLGSLKLVDLERLTVDDITHAQGISGRGARIGDYVFGFAHTGNPAFENGGYMNYRKLVRWAGNSPGTDEESDVPVVYEHAPKGGQDVLTHFNRLFVLGGVDPSAAIPKIELNTLFFSDFGGPVSDTASRWEDDVSGLTNKIVIDGDNPNDFGVGLAQAGSTMVILKRRSIHTLSGYDTDTFTSRVFSHDIGCVDRRSIVQVEGGVVFMSDRGLMFFDGYGLTDLSMDSVKSELVELIATTVGDSSVDGGYCCADTLPNSYVMVTIGSQQYSTGNQSDNARAYLVHVPTGNWTRFTSNITANPTPVAVGRTTNYQYLIDGNSVLITNAVTNPEVAPAERRGYDQISIFRRSIPALWRSKLATLSTYQRYSQLHRVFFDSAVVYNEGSDDDGGGFTVWVVQADGTYLVNEFEGPRMGDPSTFLYRRRWVVDAFPEASDCQLCVEFRDDGTYPALKRAEVYDCAYEFQVGRQRRSS